MALCLRERFYTEGLARCHDRPYDPGKLVGERDRDEPRGPAREERDDPIAQRSFAFADPFQQRRRAQHQESPDIGVALFGNGAKLLFAATGPFSVSTLRCAKSHLS
jgi:hypothetical protein